MSSFLGCIIKRIEVEESFKKTHQREKQISIHANYVLMFTDGILDYNYHVNKYMFFYSSSLILFLGNVSLTHIVDM